MDVFSIIANLREMLLSLEYFDEIVIVNELENELKQNIDYNFTQEQKNRIINFFIHLILKTICVEEETGQMIQLSDNKLIVYLSQILKPVLISLE